MALLIDCHNQNGMRTTRYGIHCRAGCGAPVHTKLINTRGMLLESREYTNECQVHLTTVELLFCTVLYCFVLCNLYTLLASFVKATLRIVPQQGTPVVSQCQNPNAILSRVNH